MPIKKQKMDRQNTFYQVAKRELENWCGVVSMQVFCVEPLAEYGKPLDNTLEWMRASSWVWVLTSLCRDARYKTIPKTVLFDLVDFALAPCLRAIRVHQPKFFWPSFLLSYGGLMGWIFYDLYRMFPDRCLLLSWSDYGINQFLGCVPDDLKLPVGLINVLGFREARSQIKELRGPTRVISEFMIFNWVTLAPALAQLLAPRVQRLMLQSKRKETT